jgi:tRNA-splicing ligase RtcB (3'-phosphate/5'-hydroxy nucleic acid ligase)
MRVPGVVFATESLLPAAAGDRALEQVANVACLPGVVEASYAMPDVHWGYGFPIGGVAATDIDDGGVVSPGGVGFDISCGVRLLVSDIDRSELGGGLDPLMDALGRAVPRGAGPGGVVPDCRGAELDEILLRGPARLVERGMGVDRDLERCEGHGTVPGADPDAVGARARQRGAGQLGSLGSGNHFVEVQAVDSVFDAAAAAGFGLRPDAVCVLVHCGSRGLGHQVCSDHVRLMVSAAHRHGIEVPDRQLACVPVRSPEGERYLAAMSAAANYGMANRQALTHALRRAFDQAGWGEPALVYDVSHNLAKIEKHRVDGRERALCVHRKGATRAFPPHDPELPAELAEPGQPVLVPGSMGTASHVLAGVAGGPAFHSACHGAGRVLSRHAAARRVPINALRREMAEAGVHMRGASTRGLVEEAPESYKDVDEVIRACDGAGLARPVARLVPLGVVKG